MTEPLPPHEGDPTRASTDFEYSRGTEQGERMPRGLQDGYFQLDERDAGELLQWIGRVAANLRWVGGEHDEGPGGGWGPFYRENPVHVLAEIVSIDGARARAAVARMVSDDTERVGLHLQALAAGIERWYRVLKSVEDPLVGVVADRLKHLIEVDLAPILAPHLGLGGGEGERPSGTRDVGEGDWGPVVGPAQALGLQEEAFGGRIDPSGSFGVGEPERTEEGDETPLTARGVYRELLGGIGYLQESSRLALERLLSQGVHEPAFGLVLTLIQLYGRVQKVLNRFPERRLTFYYRDVLGLRPRARSPDRAHLVLRPSPGTERLLIPRGTRFSGGQDDGGDELVFASDEDVWVSDAEVTQALALHLERDEDDGHVVRILAQRGGRPQSGRAGDEDGRPLLFGRGDLETHRFGGESARIGFAVASPALALAEGTRKITVRVRFRSDPLTWSAREQEPPMSRSGPLRSATIRTDGYTYRLTRAEPGPGSGVEDREDRTTGERSAEPTDEKAGGREGAALPEPSHGGGPVPDLSDAFQAKFTGPGGWVEVDELQYDSGEVPESFELLVKLGPETDPFVGWSSELHGGGYDTDLPVLRFRLRVGAAHEPYGWLATRRLEGVTIDVDVEGTSDLVIHNEFGLLDASSPFMPFGPAPTRDSYFVVGSREAALKRLTKAWLRLEWGNLPRVIGGFEEHYRDYAEPRSTVAFRTDVAALRGREWVPRHLEERATRPLFKLDDEGRVDRTISVQLSVPAEAEPIRFGTSPEAYGSLAKMRSGYFRLGLGGADATFGHDEYVGLQTRALMENARRKEPRPEPRPPYSPVVRRLILDYRARDVLAPGSGNGHAARDSSRIYHEHPFGLRDLSAVADVRGIPIVPAPPAGVPQSHEDPVEYVFFGLQATSLEGALSLLVQVRSDLLPVTPPAAGRLRWFYLTAEGWRELPSNRVLSDSTAGFQRSGIVTLDLPGDMDERATVLPGGVGWVAVGVPSDLMAVTARLVRVSAGAVPVTWVDLGNPRSSLEMGLAAGTIERPVASIPGLGGVEQVGPSFGGRAGEGSQQFTTRVSERLRHKGRAVSPWDYERLVLDEFPDVFKVKVFPNTDPGSPVAVPGRVLVVVVPRPSGSEADLTRSVRLSGARLAEIQSSLQSRASGSAQITTMNPVYEYIEVRCAVKLKGGRPTGISLRQLNRLTVRFLSPWGDEGYGPRFGWRVRTDDVVGRLRKVPFVEFVTDFSMLQVTRKLTGRYRLGDTARISTRSTQGPPERGFTRGSRDLEAFYPWSLALPVSQHDIRITESEARPDMAGIGDLKIGSNFIVGADENE